MQDGLTLRQISSGTASPGQSHLTHSDRKRSLVMSIGIYLATGLRKYQIMSLKITVFKMSNKSTRNAGKNKKG